MNIRRSLVGLRVLLVEDDPLLAEDLGAWLRAAGCHVVGRADCGRDAVEAALRAQPELLLMEVELHDEFEEVRTSERIQALLRLPVVYLTDQADHAALRLARTRHAAGYAMKPIHVPSLLSAMEGAVRRFDLERQLEYSQLTHAAILASVSDGVLATDLTGCIQFLNPMAERLTGWSLGDAQGRPVGEVLQFADEDGVVGEERLVAKVLASRSAIALGPDEYLRGRFGAVTPVEGVISPVTDQLSRLVGVTVTLRNLLEAGPGLPGRDAPLERLHRARPRSSPHEAAR